MRREETYCDSCKEGMENKCPHAEGRHYDPWGEGIAPPDFCPFTRRDEDDLPF